MPPSKDPPLSASLGQADFGAILRAVKAAITEATAIPQLLDGVAAQRYVGLSKSGWHRAKSAGLLPKPVYVEGSGDRYRKADLDRYVERLRPRRTNHRSDAA